MKIESSREDYLRIIYKISEREKGGSDVQGVAVARDLAISRASVSQMIKKLQAENLVKLNLDSKISLTKKGLKVAQKLTHGYRVLEVFLKDVLKYDSLDEIREEAHVLEHAFSEKSIKRLDEFLGFPNKCPHGDKID